MIKYYKELEDRENYYLPLFDKYAEEKKFFDTYDIPLSFMEKYSNLLKTGEYLINFYKNFDIYEWFEKNKNIDCGTKMMLLSSFSEMDEQIDFNLAEYKKIKFSSKDIREYLLLIRELAFCYSNLFSNNKEYYNLLCEKVEEALKELREYTTIQCRPKKEVNLYQHDAWYITPNGYLYNVEDHKSRNLFYSYNQLKNFLIENKNELNFFEDDIEDEYGIPFCIDDNKTPSDLIFHNVNNQVNLDTLLYAHEMSNEFLNMATEIKERGYITSGQFNNYFHYYRVEPVYLEHINGVPVTREPHILKLTLGIINAYACFYRFFEDLNIYTENPQNELNKIIEWTNDDIKDILVRCCGFHKIESTQEKTITTSCVNYEKELEEYIKNGWKVVFIPPFIIDKDNKCIKQYPEDFLVIKKVLKK